MLSDADPSIDNANCMDLYLANNPAGASYRNTLH